MLHYESSSSQFGASEAGGVFVMSGQWWQGVALSGAAGCGWEAGQQLDPGLHPSSHAHCESHHQGEDLTSSLGGDVWCVCPLNTFLMCFPLFLIRLFLLCCAVVPSWSHSSSQSSAEPLSRNYPLLKLRGTIQSIHHVHTFTLNQTLSYCLCCLLLFKFHPWDRWAQPE